MRISVFPQLSSSSSICACNNKGIEGSSRSSSSKSLRSDSSRVTAERSEWEARTDRMKRVRMADVDEMPERRYSIGREAECFRGCSMMQDGTSLKPGTDGAGVLSQSTPLRRSGASCPVYSR